MSVMEMLTFGSGRVMRFGLLIAVFLGDAAWAQDRDATIARLRELKDRLVAAEKDAKDAAPQLTDEDLDLLEAAQLYQGGAITDHDLALFVPVLRFGRSLPAEEWATVAAFAASDDGAAVAWGLLFLLGDRARFDEAARVVVACAVSAPKGNRSYAVWKWWETSFGSRRTYPAMTHDLSLALIRCFKAGTAAERAVIAELFSRPGLTDDDLPALEQQSKEGAQRLAAALAENPVWPAKVWLEDRRGLREVDRLAALQRNPIRHEVRLAKPVAGGGAAQAWGTLVAAEDYSGDGVAAMHVLLQRLAGFAGGPPGEFDSLVSGEIAVVPRSDADELYELHSRIEAIAKELVTAIGACFELVTTCSGDPSEARRAEVAEAARRTVEATRAAARRLAFLTSPEARRAPDPDGDAAVIEGLRKASEHSFTRLSGIVVTELPEPPQIVVGEHIATVCGRGEQPRLELVPLRREDLKGASIEAAGARDIAVTLPRPVAAYRVYIDRERKALHFGRIGQSLVSVTYRSAPQRDAGLTLLRQFAEGR